jgi:ankyrin repeat protein
VLLLPERLAEAARGGDIEMTRQCISELPAGAPVCGKDSYGWTSLHYAASGGHLELCQLLLEARGDANAEFPDFSTPIMLAVEEGNLPVAELLLQHGAKTRSKDEAGFTVLDRCAPAKLEEFKTCVQQHCRGAG